MKKNYLKKFNDSDLLKILFKKMDESSFFCSFFPYRDSVKEIACPTTSNIKDTSIYRSEDFSTFYYGKKIPTFSISIKDPLQLAEYLMSYDKLESPTLIRPESVILPNEQDRNHLIILSKLPSNGLPLDYIIQTPKTSNPQVLNDTKKTIIALGIACAMEELHANGFVHKRLTTGSILLDSDFSPYIWDFYLPNLEKYDSLSALAQGYYQFLAPEALYKNDATKECDVFSFGLILKQLGDNLPLYPSKYSDYDLYARIQRGQVPEVTTGKQSFRFLVSRCLSVDPSKRLSFTDIVKFLWEETIFPDTDMQEVHNYIGDLQKERYNRKNDPNYARSVEDIKKYLLYMRKVEEEAMKGNDIKKTLLYGKYLTKIGEPNSSLKFLKKAAKMDNPIALYAYGCALLSSDTIDKETKAIKYIKAASDANCTEATAKYAEMLWKGRGCTKNLTLALKLFKSAAAKDCLSAIKGYAEMLHDCEEKNENLKEIFKYTKKAAKLGGPEEHFLLAKLYQTGRGIQKNMRKAFEHYNIAAEGNYQKAINTIQDIKKNGEKLSKKPTDIFRKSNNSGDVTKSDQLMIYIMMLLIGTKDIPKDIKTALKLLKIASQKGYPEAQYEYSKILKVGYENLQPTEKDSLLYLQYSAQNGFVTAQLEYANYLFQAKKLQDSSYFYKQAADKGSAEAQLIYGDMKYNGKDGKQNQEEGLKYIQLSADQGYPKAMFQYGQCLEANNTNNDPQQLQKALSYYRLAKKENIEESDERIAMILIKLGTNLDEAGQLLEKLAEKGNGECIYQLGLMCVSGVGAKQDFQRASELFKKGLSLGVINCEFELSKLVYLGLGVQKNQSKSLDYFSKIVSTKQNQLTAKNIIGFAYYMGQGYKQDKTKAISIWKQAADEGGPEASYNYAIAANKEEVEGANKLMVQQYLKQSSDAGFPLASFQLAEIMSSEGPKKTNYPIIQTLYVKAANKGHIPSMLKAAINYDQGKCPGVERSVAKALELFRKAADIDKSIVEIDERPEWTCFRTDFVISERFFASHEAFEHDISSAMQRVGEILLNGEAGIVDHSLAKSYFEKASKHGNIEAIFQLGQLYEHGLGVEKNPAEAHRLYEIAAKHNHKFAQLYCSIPNPESEVENIFNSIPNIDEIQNIDTNSFLNEILSENSSQPDLQKALRNLMEQSALSDDDYFNEHLKKLGYDDLLTPPPSQASLTSLETQKHLKQLREMQEKQYQMQLNDINPIIPPTNLFKKPMSHKDLHEQIKEIGANADFLNKNAKQKMRRTCLPQLEIFDLLSYINSQSAKDPEKRQPIMMYNDLTKNAGKEPFPKRKGGFIQPITFKRLTKKPLNRKPIFHLDLKALEKRWNEKKEKIKQIEEPQSSSLYESNFNLEMEILKNAADSGNPAAQFELATMLEAGDRVKRDSKLAAFYFKKAEEQGFTIQNLASILSQPQ